MFSNANNNNKQMSYHDDDIDDQDNHVYNSSKSNIQTQITNTSGLGRNSLSSINARFSNARSVSQQLDDEQQFEETQQFLKRTKDLAAVEEKRKQQEKQQQHQSAASLKRKKALLAKQETLEEGTFDSDGCDKKSLTSSTSSACAATCCGGSNSQLSNCFRMLFNFVKRKRIFIPIIIISLIAAIYCLPYVEIDARTPQPLPYIPFNFKEGPLKDSSASQFKVERLFYDQIYGAESVALDSMGNMYMAIEGGFILYAHLNKSSPIKRSYYDDASLLNSHLLQQQYESSFRSNYNTLPSLQQPTSLSQKQLSADDIPELVKIAELNGIKQMPYEYRRRPARDGADSSRTTREGGGVWRRECQLDEKVYGQQLVRLIDSTNNDNINEVDTGYGEHHTRVGKATRKFRSNIVISRCSKPLGIRLSPDESYLYVIDTLSGLYRISLKVSDKPNSSQRLVNKLIDFKNNKNWSRQLLPVVHFDKESSSATRSVNFDNQNQKQVAPKVSMLRTARNSNDATISPTNGLGSSNNNNEKPIYSNVPHLNISLTAIDDLAIDYGAGSRGGDMIYMSDASQRWQAISFVYEMLEGKPSGAILRFDTGSNQLSVLDPNQVNHVRTSNLDITDQSSRLYSMNNYSSIMTDYNDNNELPKPYMGIGAPRLDENDVFDDRPLHFPNGIELTDDKQAILIADTINKRIIKHYIKGSRRGTSDLWAWTPHFPDNIRRGYDKNQETYWVTGCGHDTTNQRFDLATWLNSYPRIRKYLLKNIYLFGWIIEQFGAHIMGSVSIRDFGYQLKIGSSLIESSCSGMMILQYNKYGDLIRSIHSKEFPKDLVFYSQTNEVFDSKSQEHILYLSSPSYKYVTKLVLPTDSYYVPPTSV